RSLATRHFTDHSTVTPRGSISTAMVPTNTRCITLTAQCWINSNCMMLTFRGVPSCVALVLAHSHRRNYCPKLQGTARNRHNWRNAKRTDDRYRRTLYRVCVCELSNQRQNGIK